MKTIRNFLIFLSKLSAVVFALSIQLPVWGQQEQGLDPDRERISRMDVRQLIQSILNVRTDLRDYSMDDLTTTSGQYELLYDEAMGPCKRRKDPSQVYELCTGGSVNIGFFDYLKSNQRICPDPQTGSCWKPALHEQQMREELLELVRKIRNHAAHKKVGGTAVLR